MGVHVCVHVFFACACWLRGEQWKEEEENEEEDEDEDEEQDQRTILSLIPRTAS